MSVQIRRLTTGFAGEVSGIDAARPLLPGVAEEIDAGMAEYGVLVFRNQVLTDEQQAAFSENFGQLELPSAVSNITKSHERRLGPAMADVSNLTKEHRPFDRDDRRRMFNLGNRLWHSDSSFRAVPAKYSLLSGRILPSSGGNTEFADMTAAYEALDTTMKARIEDLVCEHSLLYSRGRLGFEGLTEEEKTNFHPVRQALVRTHPANGRKSLYLSAHAGRIVGWPVPEGRLLLEELTEHATQRDFVYVHEWRINDSVVWDNRRTMHRARPFDDVNEVRDMRRTTVAGESMTAAQAA